MNLPVNCDGLSRLVWEFEHPADEFSPMPFWFWNDTLTEEEIARQMRQFKAHGVDGFVIHPRLGLDPEIPYMGERWLYFVRYAVTLAKELQMKVILYDEARDPASYCHSGQWVKFVPIDQAEYARIRKLALAGEYTPVIYQRKEGE